MQKDIAKNSLLLKLANHKKIILAAILPLGFWVGILGFWYHNSTQQKVSGPIVKSTQQNNLTSEKSIDQIASIGASIDSDNDGLSNWEETVYGTDPHKSDTDSDGYLDGEEVLSGHNPLKKGPDDLMKSKSPTNSQGASATATEKLSKIVIENYLKTIQGQGSQNISSDQLSQILAQSFNSDSVSSGNFNDILKSELYYFIPPSIDQEIKTSNDNSDKNIKKYWDNIGKLFSELMKTAPSYDLLKIINESIATKDYTKLDEVIAYYKNSYESVKIISVPSSLISSHKNIATIFYKHWKISEAVKNFDQDPMLTLLALNELATILQNAMN